MTIERLCTKNTSWALIERPYNCAPQAVGAVYDRPGFFVQSPLDRVCEISDIGILRLMHRKPRHIETLDNMASAAFIMNSCSAGVTVGWRSSRAASTVRP